MAKKTGKYTREPKDANKATRTRLFTPGVQAATNAYAKDKIKKAGKKAAMSLGILGKTELKEAVQARNSLNGPTKPYKRTRKRANKDA